MLRLSLHVGLGKRFSGLLFRIVEQGSSLGSPLLDCPPFGVQPTTAKKKLLAGEKKLLVNPLHNPKRVWSSTKKNLWQKKY